MTQMYDDATNEQYNNKIRIKNAKLQIILLQNASKGNMIVL